MRRRPFSYFEPEPSYRPIERVGRIPMTLLRTTLVTRDPAQMEAALEDYEEDVPPVDFIFPQRVAWQQWKDQLTDVLNGGVNRPRHATAVTRIQGLTEAILSGKALEHLTARAVPEAMIYEHEAAHSLMTQGAAGQYPDAPMDEAPVLLRDLPAYGRPVVPAPFNIDIPEPEQIPTNPRGQGIDRSLRDHRYEQTRVLSYMLADVRSRG